jgi:hypothetical protein
MSDFSADKSTIIDVDFAFGQFYKMTYIDKAYTPQPYTNLYVGMTWKQLSLALYEVMLKAGVPFEEVGAALMSLSQAYDRRHAADPIIDPPEDNLTDAETLASAGYGTDEDYGGCDERLWP